jgi:NCS1 family nucleobase:cation symporter-1
MPGMINSLNSSIDIGNAKYIYCMACLVGAFLSMGTHVLVSKLFPDRDSLIAEAVDAYDVLDGLVPAYEHLARRDAGTRSLDSEKKLDEAETEIHQVVV